MKPAKTLVAAALAALIVLALTGPAAAQIGEPVRIVLLVHGWNGSENSFGIVPRLLGEAQKDLWPAGYWHTAMIDFKPPRADVTLPEQAAHVGQKVHAALERFAREFPDRPREIWFLTHSMGALIVRQLYLDHHDGDNSLAAAFRDLKGAILVAPPNQGSDEVRFAIYQLEKGLSGLTGDLLSDRSLRSLTNKAIGSMLKGLPLEQAYNMASGSDFIEALNLGWHKAGACERFPLWILAGAHDVVVDLANANINALQVSPDHDGRTRCVRCAVDPARVRYYPYNHSNTNRRDGIFGSVEGADHPVFADIARILLGRPLPPVPAAVGPSKLFLRFRHPSGDRITDVSVHPFEDALTEAHTYEMNLPAGKVVGFRQKDFVVLAGLPRSLVPLAGSTLLTVTVKAERRGLLPPLVPYAPKLFKSQLDWGPQGLVRARTFTYRPVQISIPESILTTNSVVSLTIPLSETPADVPESATVIPGGCPPMDGDGPARLAAAEKALAGGDTEDTSRALRRLGGTQDPALVGLLVRYTADTYPPPLRRAAVAALGDLRAPGALDPLRKLANAEDPKLKALALDAVGRVPSVLAASMLVEVLATPGDAKLERAALAGLSQMTEPLVREALDRALGEEATPARRSRVSSLALACGQATAELIAVVAGQALAAGDQRVAPDPYGRILDSLVEHASPDDRTWIRRMRREAGQRGDATWTRALLERVASRNRGSGAPAPGDAGGAEPVTDPEPAPATGDN